MIEDLILLMQKIVLYKVVLFCFVFFYIFFSIYKNDNGKKRELLLLQKFINLLIYIMVIKYVGNVWNVIVKVQNYYYIQI